MSTPKLEYVYAVAIANQVEGTIKQTMLLATSEVEAMITALPILEVCMKESVEFQTVLTVGDLDAKAFDWDYLISAIKLPVDPELFKKITP